MKVVINRCYGGFGLSEKAKQMLGIEYDFELEQDKTNPKLVEVVEKLGEAASAKYAELKVVEVPDDVKWGIEDYDGMETIHEVHRVWY